MSKPRFDMEDKMELLAYLEAMLTCVKSLHASVASVMAEVEKMHQSAFEDAAEINVCKQSVRTGMATAKRLEDGIRSCDEMAEEIAASQRYTN